MVATWVRSDGLAATFAGTGAGKNLRASDFLTVRCGICGVEKSGLPVDRVKREVINGEVQVVVAGLAGFAKQEPSVSVLFLVEIEDSG